MIMIIFLNFTTYYFEGVTIFVSELTCFKTQHYCLHSNCAYFKSHEFQFQLHETGESPTVQAPP